MQKSNSKSSIKKLLTQRCLYVMIIKLSHLATKNLIIKIVIDISFERCDNDLVGKLILLNQIENNF